MEGHAGVFRTGLLNGVPCVALRGRAHLYEGHPAHHAALPVRAMAHLGIKALFVSNAAGGINRTYSPGDLMLIVDHLNLMGCDPLRGDGLDEQLAAPDLSQAYDPVLCDEVRAAAIEHGIALREGVYGGFLGPTFETPSEVRMAARLGADAVGMSTVPEVITARAMGVRCFGVSCITNLGAGINPEPLSHFEVIETTDRIAATFQSLVLAALVRVADRAQSLNSLPGPND